MKSKQKVARPSTPSVHPPQAVLVPGPRPLSKPTHTGQQGRGVWRETGWTRSSSRRPLGLVTPMTPPSPAGPWGRPLRPVPLLPRGASRSRAASLRAAAGRARPGRAEGGGEGREGRGGGWKARESALRAAPLPRACQQRALGGSGPNCARRLASSASAASGLRGSPGLSEVPARPGSSLHRPAPAPQLACPPVRPGEGSKRASAPSPEPRAPAPRGDEGPGR